MSQVRPFHRDDRDQLTELVNAHAAAVVPGVSVSVNTVLSSLERQPEEFVTDPWVAERVTLVAELRRQLVAAAHLLRYRSDAEVGADLRNAGEIAWFLWHPPASFRPGTDKAADLLMAACLAQLARWQVRLRYASGDLPAPVVYGLPRNWPHVRSVYERAGFRHTGSTEVILLAQVSELPRLEPRPGVTVERTVGECGTRLTACEAGQPVGFVEVDTSLARPERQARAAGLADVGNLHVDPARHGAGWEQRLLGHAADWLRLSGVDRLLAYEPADDHTRLATLRTAGFRELTRTDRGWEHRPRRGSGQMPGRYRSG
ncbi:N-acetyltransferase [Streptomyces sp. NPDC001843]|uniref:N-acetyltransferase n=1 Tax=Streptomyces sp. NPDC001843 TaxID=3364617 RepID=UPI0036CD51C8